MTDSPSPALWKLAETADKVKLLQEIDRLSEQVDYWRKKAQSLERELHKEVRTARERPFGNDTPSSKQLFRPDAPEAKVARKGGAKPGHDGHGRHCASEEDADEVVELAKPVASRQHLGVWASEHSGRRGRPLRSDAPSPRCPIATAKPRDGARSATGR